MHSCPRNYSTKENGEIPEDLVNEWDELEDELIRKKKKRLVSKYSEKRFVP